MALELTDRVYLQIVPDDAEVKVLVELQARLRLAGVRGRFADPSRLHMTIVHVGELQRAYDEAKVWSPSLTPELFLSQAEKLVKAYEKLTPIVTTLTLKRLVLYGVAGKTIAVTASVDLEVQTMYQSALTALKAFFVEIGIEYVDAFMKGSQNFRHAAAFSPHITLIKAADNSHLPELNVPDLSIRCHNTAVRLRHGQY